jgi:hypothetical protein
LRRLNDVKALFREAIAGALISLNDLAKPSFYMDSNQESFKTKLKYRLLALLIGVGVPLGSYKLFQYDELLHMALKFPNWLIGIFAGPMAGLPLGIVVASFPIFLAGASGASVYFAWKFWNHGAASYSMIVNQNLSKAARRIRWILTMAIVIPIYSIVLVLRASGSYFHDGLVPFWIEKGFSVERLKVIVPYSLYSLFILACLVSWIAVLRYKIKLAQAIAAQCPPPEPVVDGTSAMQAPLPSEKPNEGIPTTLFKAVFVANGVLLAVTIFFIKFFGRR